uniref:Uncharacterized protein n=1 Tax=Mycena chlorophos TaxID=658473 RepID=A0ABQ0LRQ8_MYCCL|nr:predicted protein [Mycena chlorophos]
MTHLLTLRCLSAHLAFLPHPLRIPHSPNTCRAAAHTQGHPHTRDLPSPSSTRADYSPTRLGFLHTDRVSFCSGDAEPSPPGLRRLVFRVVTDNRLDGAAPWQAAPRRITRSHRNRGRTAPSLTAFLCLIRVALQGSCSFWREQQASLFVDAMESSAWADHANGDVVSVWRRKYTLPRGRKWYRAQVCRSSPSAIGWFALDSTVLVYSVAIAMHFFTC